jgi:hypothetical protein
VVLEPGIGCFARCTLVHRGLAISHDFLGNRLAGATDCDHAGVLADGRGHCTLGRAVLLYWHPLFSRWIGAYTPLPGLITDLIPGHAFCAHLLGPQRDEPIGP